VRSQPAEDPNHGATTERLANPEVVILRKLDRQCREEKWLFGGKGYPYKINFRQMYPPDNLLRSVGLEGDEWIPANLPTFINDSGQLVVDFTPLQRQDVPGSYATLDTASGGAPGSRWGWLDVRPTQPAISGCLATRIR